MSQIYVNREGLLLWECSCGNQWNAKAKSIVNGVWCPQCSLVRKREVSRQRNTQRLSIQEMRLTAAQYRGECVSEEYTNAHTKLRWKCENGHEWEAVPNSVRSGTWCPCCAGKRGSSSLLDEAVAIAEQRGGKCLSEEFQGDKIKLKWECFEKHQWEAVLYTIRKGSWCPECSGGLGERLLRTCMEQLFQKPFPKIRPTWLKGSKGVPLELDGYCESLGIAFEHHGLQHFRAVSWTGRSTVEEDAKAFTDQKRRDKRKLRLCALNGVKVLVVPEIPTVLAIEDVKSKIERELIRDGVPLPEGFAERTIDFSRVYSVPRMREMEAELQQLAAERGGRLVAGSYSGMAEKARWQCSEGHEWEAACGSVKGGTWCPRCSGRIVTINDAREFAVSRGGSCLSLNYVNNKQKMLWRCKAGHQWKATWERTKEGAWCIECGSDGRKDSRLEEMKEIARLRGGECLSLAYKNPRTLLRWRCKDGHEWAALSDNVKSKGSWCPYCVEKGKVTLEMAQADAATKGGRCLATEIGSVNTPVRWQCAVGHEWMAAPAKIRGKGRKGTWCPHCAGKVAYSIEHAKKLAVGRGGACLSNKYNGAHGVLDWECENGHCWSAVFNSVKQGSWCPECPAGRGRRARLLALDALVFASCLPRRRESQGDADLLLDVV
jgi:hypothetical protein